MKTARVRNVFYLSVLSALLLVTLSSNPARANQYDDEENVRRAAEQLQQIEQDARDEAHYKYNVEHGIVPNSWSESWKQAEYETRKRKEEEAQRTASTPPAPSQPAASTPAVKDNSNSGIPAPVIVFFVLMVGVVYMMKIIKKANKARVISTSYKVYKAEDSIIPKEETAPPEEKK